MLLSILVILFSYLVFSAPLGFESGAGDSQKSESQITDNLKTAVDSGATVDFSNPLYNNNAELVKKVLREKYHLNINSFIGAKIENGNLIIPGGTSINLKTGKTITLDSAGASINSFSDGSLVVVNAVGVTYDGTNLKVVRGQRIFYEGTESTNVRNFVGEQSTVSLISADLIVAGNGNLLSKVTSVVIQKTPTASQFSFVCASSDQSTVGSIKINCLPNTKVKADTTAKGASLTMDKDITFEHNTIQGNADQDNAQFSYQEISPNNEQIITKLTTLKIQFNGIQQTIIAKTETKFKLDETEGIYELSLGTESRFSHQEQDETKNYYLLNPGQAPYTVFITTTSHQMSAESALALYNGFIDRAQNYFALNSIITFGIYKNLLPHDIFESTEAENQVVIDTTHLSLTNGNCEADRIFFSLHNADFNILETCHNNQPERYADFEHQDTPSFLTKYSSNNAEITFTNGILKQSKNGNFFTLFPQSSLSVFSQLMQSYDSRFVQCTQMESSKLKSFSEVLQE
ncbi:MAG: hypothetical protein Q7R76_01055 [Candidatus Woesearchaeota archaeon]|nr:hypothetical protein [Candidatus Woesearchaeota archaeon]